MVAEAVRLPVVSADEAVDFSLVAARDPEGAKLRVAVTDGERALQTRVKKAAPGIVLILDRFHAKYPR